VFGCAVYLLDPVSVYVSCEVGMDVHGGLLIDVSGVLSYTGYDTSQKVTSQVDFTHYDGEPITLAVNLVNTDQRPVGGDDAISNLASLKAFLDDYQDMWGDIAQPPRRGDLTAIHNLRDELSGVFTAHDEAEATARLNNLLSQDNATVRISTQNGHPHLHFQSEDSTMKSWLAVTTAMGVAAVLVDHGLERFGSCQSSTCEDVYVDTSRNRSRCHCSTQCSTREAVAAYRKRQRA
jgi:predicted RNA-binding Zn ribbon-like protein